MTRAPVITLIIVSAVILLLPPRALSAVILGPRLTLHNNDILVSTGLTNIEEVESAIESGIEKEITFTLELFKAWKFWPDAFVVSRNIQRVIRHDSLRDHYLVVSDDGKTRIEKQFKDFRTMKAWAFTIRDITLVNVRELDPGSYYLRVVVESKSRELPPVIGLLMLFIPEVEMSLAKESKPFMVGDTQ